MDQFRDNIVSRMASTSERGDIAGRSQYIEAIAQDAVDAIGAIPNTALTPDQLQQLAYDVIDEVESSLMDLDDAVGDAASQTAASLGREGDAAIPKNKVFEFVGNHPWAQKTTASLGGVALGALAYYSGMADSTKEVVAVATTGGVGVGAGTAVYEKVFNRNSGDGQKSRAVKRHVIGARSAAHSAYNEELNGDSLRHVIAEDTVDWISEGEGAKQADLLPGGSLNPSHGVTIEDYNKSVAVLVGKQYAERYLNETTIKTTKLNSREDAEAAAIDRNKASVQSSLERAEADRDAAKAVLEARVAADPTVAPLIQREKDLTKELADKEKAIESNKKKYDDAVAKHTEAKNDYNTALSHATAMAALPGSGITDPRLAPEVQAAAGLVTTANREREKGKNTYEGSETDRDTAEANLTTAQENLTAAKELVMQSASTQSDRVRLTELELEVNKLTRSKERLEGITVPAGGKVEERTLKKNAEKAGELLPTTTNGQITRRAFTLGAIAALGTAGGAGGAKAYDRFSGSSNEKDEKKDDKTESTSEQTGSSVEAEYGLTQDELNAERATATAEAEATKTSDENP